MSCRSCLLPVLLLPTIAAAACGGSPEVTAAPPEDDLFARARAIHDRITTIDSHADIPFDFATAAVDPGVRGTRQVDLPKMREGGLDAAFFIVYVGQTARTPQNYAKARADAMVKFDAIHRMTREMYPDVIELADRADDIARIRASGKLAAAIGIENGYVIGTDLALLAQYHALGARYITLAHGGHNDIADSATPRAWESPVEHGGLSAFGRRVIDEMNRLGIIVDVSHISRQAMLEAVTRSQAPVFASHSSARALTDHPRNLDDTQLLALAARRGVVQIVALDDYVRSSPGPVELADFVDHIDHAVQVAGLDHVGISSDFGGGGGVLGWNDASETFNVTLELVRRGYTETAIEKLWGGNLLRVWREVEHVAAGLTH